MGYELMTQLEGKLAGLSHAIKSCSSAMDILNMCALVDVNERPFSFCRRLIWVKYIYTDYPHTVVHPIDYCINRYFNFLKNVACYCVFAGKAKSACTRCFVFLQWRPDGIHQNTVTKPCRITLLSAAKNCFRSSIHLKGNYGEMTQ